MRCRIIEADHETGVVRIEARLGPLISRLRCSIEPVTADTCLLSREQSYGGPVGWFFTRFFGTREEDGTTAYLQAWGEHALRRAAEGEN
jgi:hypothetical protein